MLGFFMYRMRSDELSEPNTKRHKLNDECDSNGAIIKECDKCEETITECSPNGLIITECDPNGLITTERDHHENEAVVPSSTVPSSTVPSTVVKTQPIPSKVPEIFKLDIDCFEETIDYLPLKDLVSIGRTCKRLQQMAGYILRENYSAAVVECRDRVICINYDVKANHFAQFIRKIRIDSVRDFEHFVNIQTEFRRLRQIKLGNFAINNAKTQQMHDILSKIEFLRFNCCKIDGGFYETVLAHCPSLKRLSVEASRIGNDWLNRKYPAMQRIELVSNNIEGITEFLQLNPNIRQFATNAVCLWQNRHSLNAANIRLNDLAIRIIDGNEVDLKSFCALLNDLHARGFYQRLHLYSLYGFKQQVVKQLATINALVKVYVSHVTQRVALSAFTNLQEMCIFKGNQISDLDAVINKLTDLKRIQFRFANFDVILPFINRAPQLRAIKVDWLEDGLYFDRNTNIVDLSTLDKQREQLIDARKITFYVREEIYLATKWALNETNFPFIRLKRIDSHQWDHDFGLD